MCFQFTCASNDHADQAARVVVFPVSIRLPAIAVLVEKTFT